MSAQSSDTVIVSASAAQTFATSLLTAAGVPPTNASFIAECLVLADLRGVDTHGINRLLPYLSQLRNGTLFPASTPIVKEITPVAAHIDGQNAFGFLSARAGIDFCIAAARTFGIGMASVKNSNHFGMSAWIVQRALDACMMSLVFTNSSPAMPAWGGREQLLGVSPIAAGAPGDPPFVLDMAPSVAARGKVHKAARRGERIPEDWAIDSEGRRTDDPLKALEGSMLPMGGPKGSGLSIMMDVFSGVFSGSKFAGEVCGPYDGSREAGVGHFFVAVKPDLFISGEEFRSRLRVLYERVTGGERMEGVDRMWFPGEIELEREKVRRSEGIPFIKGEVEKLNEEAVRVGSNQLGES
ncbi:MAG: hypothetical protein MMC23_005886 [Stictis urceolatum]|nr:hypothetical protein [Stictis urceolata]